MKEMASSEKFCLKWNDFESNISSTFKEIKNDQDFMDVTLACDTDQITAHKVVLSACSPFFRNVLKRNPHQHPLLYMKGVKYSDLESLLSFMYFGEVSIAQDELNSFLAVAEELKVKGLTQNNSNSNDQNTKSESLRHTTARPRLKARSEATASATVADDDIVAIEPEERKVKTEPGGGDLVQYDDDGYNQYQDPAYDEADQSYYEGTTTAAANMDFEAGKGNSIKF